MSLLPKLFGLTKLSLPNVVSMWYCGDRSRHICPLKMLYSFDVKGMKGGWQKLSMMKVLMCSIERAAIIVNITHLLVNCWTPRESIDYYITVNHLFVVPALNKNRRYKSIVWKTYQNLPLKRKCVLVEEQHTT